MTSPFPSVTWLRGSIVAVAVFLALAGCGGGGGGSSTGGTGGSAGDTTASAAWALRATNDAGLTAYFRDALGPGSAQYAGGILAPMAPPGTTGPVFSAAPDASGAARSGTTLQEPGVDEADLIKSDGTSVFSLDLASATASNRDTLRRQRLNPANAALVPGDTYKIPFSGDVRGDGLYLDSERAQVAALGKGAGVIGVYDAWFAPQSWMSGATELALIDTSSATQMGKRRMLRITAQLIGSRRIGATLYLVLRSYPQVPGLDPAWPQSKTAANNAILQSLQATQLLPTISVDGQGAQALVQPSDCLLQEQNAVRSGDIITIVGIDLASATERHAARCFTGGTEAFYMSETNLYLATTRSVYTMSAGMPIYPTQSTTDIHKFALDGLAIGYRGSANVVGHLGFDQNRKSFRMGEYAQRLRVITQTDTSFVQPLALPPVTTTVTGSTAGGTGTAVTGTGTAPTPTTTVAPTTTTTVAPSPPSPGHLSILEERSGALAIVGELPNAARPDPLGKAGEQLYATRFVGARGYLVTYRLIDPLYVLDLSDPADPKVAGQLQVSGYSDYLFPLGDNLLLGVGKDAIADGSVGDGRFAWYQGVKVSLIDVSDPAHPVEAARNVIGRRGTTATVLSDHHGIALQTVGSTVRVSLPVSLHDTPSAFMTGKPNDTYLFTRTELDRFDIDLTAKSLTARPPVASTVSGDRSIANDRSLLWQNQVHWYQDGTWRSGGW